MGPVFGHLLYPRKTDKIQVDPKSEYRISSEETSSTLSLSQFIQKFRIILCHRHPIK